MGIENIELIMRYGEPNSPKPPRERYEEEKKKTLDTISKYLDDIYESDKENGYNWIGIAIGHDVGILD